MHIRTLTRAVVAACVLTGALGATTASAAQFKAESYPAFVRGVNATKMVITTKAGTATCNAGVNEMFGAFPMTGPVEKMVTAPVFSPSCSVSIRPESCYFSYTVGKSLNETTYDGRFAIEYPGGPSCYESESKPHYTVIKFTNCTATFKAQMGVPGLELQNFNKGSKRFVLGRLKLTGLAYELSGSLPGCEGFHTDGTFTGWQTFEAFSAEGVQMGLFIE